MWGATIGYESDVHYLSGGTTILKTKKKSHNGIKCVWSGVVYSYPSNRFSFEWQFDWDKLKNEGVDKLTGHITLISVLNSFTAKKINVELTENNQVITETFACKYINDTAYYQYFLTPYYISASPSDDEMFAPSDQNDAILIVDGKKLYVSKSFLSSHSEYFRALFSSNFKEGQMDEIPIGDVYYEDFVLLLKSFYPNPVLPTDKTVEKLLELARRFLVSSVIKVAEHHLLEMSKIDNKKMLCLADEYGMTTLLEKCICKMDKLAKVKKMKKSEIYDQLSDKTKLKVFDRLMDFI